MIMILERDIAGLAEAYQPNLCVAPFVSVARTQDCVHIMQTPSMLHMSESGDRIAHRSGRGIFAP